MPQRKPFTVVSVPRSGFINWKPSHKAKKNVIDISFQSRDRDLLIGNVTVALATNSALEFQSRDRDLLIGNKRHKLTFKRVPDLFQSRDRDLLIGNTDALVL